MSKTFQERTFVMNIDSLLAKMWQDYCALNPQALSIYKLFSEAGEKVINDHIALRTFQHPRLGIDSMAKVFVKNGYKEHGEYFFKEKKLYAQHFEHPDKTKPKIFISELELPKFTPRLQKHIAAIIDQMPDSLIQSEDFTVSGRPWKISYTVYKELAEESEYASWVAAIGFRPNHFTVYINELKKFQDINHLNQFLESKGYVLNSSGGKVKGTPELFLEQSSTMANEIPVDFNEGTYSIPGCYYEFAKRYKLPNGEFYQGFVAQSADKIFESTNARK